MKKIWAFVIGCARCGRARAAFHDDSLRANQGQSRSQTFSFWRALVS